MTYIVVPNITLQFHRRKSQSVNEPIEVKIISPYEEDILRMSTAYLLALKRPDVKAIVADYFADPRITKEDIREVRYHLKNKLFNAYYLNKLEELVGNIPQKRLKNIKSYAIFNEGPIVSLYESLDQLYDLIREDKDKTIIVSNREQKTKVEYFAKRIMLEQPLVCCWEDIIIKYASDPKVLEIIVSKKPQKTNKYLLPLQYLFEWLISN